MRAKAFFEAGARVTFSSDVVVPFEFERANPFVGMQIGHNRQDIEGGENAHVMLPEDQRLSVDQLLQGYTINGAYQLRRDDISGSIRVGKNANLIVLDNNIFQQAPYKIADINVITTIVDGEVLYTQE
jgi:predicted amidohydrolase YtcJ